LQGADETGPIFPDGDRYAFNGVLVHDMIRDGQVLNAYQYSKNFYAHYPATNLPYGPPAFAAMIALSYSIFGISFFSARIVVSMFYSAATLILFKLIKKREDNYGCSFFSVVFIFFNPLALKYGKDIAVELPVIFFSIATIYVFLEYSENNRRYFGLITAVMISLTYLTKQYVLPLILTIPIYILVQKKIDNILKKETIYSIIIATIIILPYTIVSFKYMTKDFVHGGSIDSIFIIFLGYFKIFIESFYINILFIFYGIYISFKERKPLQIFFIIWLIIFLIFFVFYVRIVEDRYFLTILPVFGYFFSISIIELFKKINNTRVKNLLTILIVLSFVAIPLKDSKRYVAGYEKAGEFIAENPYSRTILYLGNYDGSFLMGIRKNSREKKPIVLRGDRHLAMRLWWGELKDEKSLLSTYEINKFINRAKIGYIVLEKNAKNINTFEEFGRLIKFLKENNDFEIVESILIKSSQKILGSNIDIYKRKNLNFEEIEEDNNENIKIPVSGMEENILMELK
jgi:hypothetical protein